nr:MAG TPA: hypothetical protein [Caudoviricetes sp.]
MVNQKSIQKQINSEFSGIFSTIFIFSKIKP